MDRHCASRIVRRVARRGGVDKPIGPHTLRHAFITAALDAGVPLRDVQEAASHADPRTTMRYDRARVSLDRHATYIVAASAPRGALLYPLRSGERMEVNESLGLMAYPDPKGKWGQEHARKPAVRAQAYGAGCWGTRVIWRKLDCLNPNLQKAQ